MATSSSQKRERQPRVVRVATLEAAARAAGTRPVPFLVIEAPSLERIAWRDGRRAACRAERTGSLLFQAAAARNLRGEDAVAHDPGTTLFVAALFARARDARDSLVPEDCRGALSRLAAAMESGTGFRLRTGWALAHVATEAMSLDRLVAEALRRGRRESARYAFFSTVGHELRTPLAAVRGFLDTLLTEELDEPTRRRFLEIARAESVRMSRLIDGLFEVSLLDLRSTARHDAAALPGDAIAAATDAVQSLARARSIDITSDCTALLPIRIDGERLTQILINLLENGIKHGRHGGRLSIHARASSRQVEIGVDDDGPGVPVEERDLVFALGQRGTLASAGSGVGLAVVRMIVERAGGAIDITDSALGGASFRVRLPVSVSSTTSD